MTDDSVRLEPQAGLNAEAARQLALAATTTLAISQVQSAHDGYRQALAAADDQRDRAVANAGRTLAGALRVALDTYEAGVSTLTGPTDDDDDQD